MNTLIIIGAIQAMFLSFLVLTKKKKVLPDYFLAVFLIVLFLIYLLVYAAFEEDMPALLLLLININLLIAPIAYIYIASLMDREYKFRIQYLLHFIPYIISTFYYAWLFLISSEAEIDRYFINSSSTSGKPFGVIFFYYLDLLIIPFYLILIFYKLRKHNRSIKDQFSHAENIDLKWVRILSILIGIIWVITTFGMNMQSITSVSIDENTGLQISLAISTLIIFCLGYFGFKQEAIFSNTKAYNVNIVKENMPKDSKYKKSKLNKKSALEYLSIIRQYMVEKKPYLDHNFTLHELSDLVKISAHNISQVLNKFTDENYYGFVNNYRVEEFKKQIVNPDNKNFSILGIAYDCGFNSKSSFNRIFKKKTGKTPSEYVKAKGLLIN